MPDPNKIKEVVVALEAALKVAKESLAEYEDMDEEPVMRGPGEMEEKQEYEPRGKTL